ncbi:hypothetical protein AB0F57_38000 [Streptomyces tanashiensis]|uniref:hypothetical protein n=1 Tax=Streptomyces tanashiensis TaxID=67367 RepID=UPI0033CD7323
MTQEDPPRFASIWVQQSGPVVEARHNLTSDQHQQAVSDFFNGGFRPACVSGYVIDGKAHFASIWVKEDGPAMWERHNETTEQFQQACEELYPQGFFPVSISGYTVDNDPRFATIWTQADPEMRIDFRINQDLTGYTDVARVFGEHSVRPVSVASYPVGDGIRFAATWKLHTTSAWYYSLNKTHDDHQLVVNKWFGKGYRPVFIAAIPSTVYRACIPFG